jgi:hypothetical protein
MSDISGAIKDLVNVEWVAAALEVQSVFPAKIVDSYASFTPNMACMRVDLKRENDNHIMRIWVYATLKHPEETDVFGAPAIEIRVEDNKHGPNLIETVVSMLGGGVIDRVGGARNFQPVDKSDMAWLDKVSAERKLRIRIVDTLGSKGAMLLEALKDQGSLENIRDILNADTVIDLDPKASRLYQEYA